MVQSNRDMPAVGGNAGFVSKLVGSAHCGGFQREYAPPLISRRAARIVGVAAVCSVPMIVRGARSAGAAGGARPDKPPS